MTRRFAVWLSLALFGIAVSLYSVSLVLLGLNGRLASSGVLMLSAFFIFAPVGALVAAHQPSLPIGWLFCAAGVLYPFWTFLLEYARYGLLTKPGALPRAIWAGVLQLPVGVIPWMLLMYSLMIFPTGRYLTPRWGIAARVVLSSFMLVILLQPLALSTIDPLQVSNPLMLSEFGGLGEFLLVARNFLGLAVVNVFAASIVARFMRSRGDERKQLQWMAYAAALWVPPTIAAVLINILFNDPAIRAILSGASSAIFSLTLAGLSVAVGMAIWKHRLYDIDLIIRRTLVYGSLTALLAALYWGGVAGLQTILRPFVGEGNDLAIVATTLLIAALFLPLRRAIQRFIDRRFYRRKYDAARTLAAFSTRVRDEVDLNSLTGHLVRVVDDTMQPEHVSLWLRTAYKEVKP